ncbi:MAG: ATP-binding protein [Bacillota bacterium]|nr:ATP-binding protein [Bacillota bacterium]
MKDRIFGAMCIISVVAIVLTTIFISILTYREFRINMEEEVQNQTEYVAAGIEEGGESYLKALASSSATNRITIVAPDGEVLYDNKVSVDSMENHKDREEIAQALRGGAGDSTRLSTTMGEETYYYAVKLAGGDILRIANTTDSVFATFLSMLPWMMALALLVLLIALAISRRQTQWILAPLNDLDLENPDKDQAYGELSPLVLRIHQQNREIERQLDEMKNQQREFKTITKNMSEGLVLLNNSCHIISVNPSAKRVLGADDHDYEGRHILELNRNLSLQKVAEGALRGESGEETFTRAGGFYLIQANPVYQDGEIKGAIILVLDITQRHKAEEMRREFSANVSHELKTPLTAISGYAELLENGMVEDKDIKEFSRRIHLEALHLLELIDDIMKISRLDEDDAAYLWKSVDLYALAQDVCGRLEHLAASKNIDVRINGVATVMEAVPRLMDELIYNLVDNAIKYSDKDTQVTVTVENTGSMALISVEDQGVGIAPEYQDRVFERFFRVDESHARSTGGTGLGLAIVKHVVTYHNGSITLKSAPKKGTKITVSFPL